MLCSKARGWLCAPALQARNLNNTGRGVPPCLPPGGRFFITGESYAGVYVPTLAKELLDNAKGQVNFKGLAVGDPCTDNTAQQDSMDMVWYGNKNGFVLDQE